MRVRRQSDLAISLMTSLRFCLCLPMVFWFGGLSEAAEAEANAVTVTRPGGEIVEGVLLGWEEGWPRVSPQGSTQVLGREELFRVEWPTGNRTVENEGVGSLDRVRLVNGDILMVQFVGMTDDDAFRLRCEDGFELTLPLEFVRSVTFAGKGGDGIPRELRAATDDVAILQNGDRIQGELLSVNDTSFEWQTVLGPAKVDRGQVAAIQMNPEWLAEIPSPPEFTLLELANGSVVTAHDLEVSPTGRLLCRFAVDHQLEIALDLLLRATWYGERIRPLTDVDVASFQHVPYLLGSRSLAVNENVFHQPLTLRGRAYQRGFGMLSGSTLQFELDDAAQAFVAVVGLDDAAGAEGSVVCSVEVDGETVWQGPVQRGGEPPLRVGPVPLHGGKRLSLRVDYADYGDIRDVVNWCDPRLTQTP